MPPITTYKTLSPNDLHPQALSHFNRFQETTKAWVNQQGKLSLEANSFIDDWNTEKKTQVIHTLNLSLTTGGFVIGAYQANHLIGFANVEGSLFGSANQYLELSYIHVSNGIRKEGIGRKLFVLCCEKAKLKGAKKLYISGHPAQETQAFYQAMGCVLAQEINSEIFQREPLDLQLEILL